MGFRKKGKLCAVTALTLSAALACGAVLCGFSPVQWGASIAGGMVANEVTSRLKTLRLPEVSTTTDATSGGESIPDKIGWNSDTDILGRAGKNSYQANLFLQKGYIVALAWNVDSARYDTVRQLDGYSVAFTAKTKGYADHAAVMQAVQDSVARQELREKSWGTLPLEEAVLLGVDGPFSGTPDELATRFYNADNLSYFSAAMVEVTGSTCDALAERAYADDRIEFFAIATGVSEGISTAKLEDLTRRAARDGKTEFFAVAADELPDATRAAFAEDAYKSGRIEIFSIVSGSLDESGLLTYARRAAQDGRVEFFSVASDGVSKTARAGLAVEAYDAKHIEIFHIACDALTEAQAASLADRAYADDRIEFFYAVSDQLSAAKRAELAARAKQDGKTEFYYAATE